MNSTTASCGHSVAAVGAPGSVARQRCENHPCGECVKRMQADYPKPIPNATKFQNNLSYEEPVTVHKWQWSVTFGNWSALCTFADGWHGWTWPKGW